ncbi:nuclear transport factor 2 family protein [Pseudonocardia xishanensis]|uniref:SnoaL-like domain-containing protein n=1 Tax=Pseudonocardia xishanensis TaxID=630995 RepID=A0ABP8RX78_9PSEU
MPTGNEEEFAVPEQSIREQLAALQDRTAIVEVVCRFAVAIDRRRWADFSGCFADQVDVNTIRTGRWIRMKRETLVGVMRRVFETYTATQHISANHQVAIDGDTAVVCSTLNATHYLRGEPDGEFHQQVGYYEYQLVRGDDSWRISSVEQFCHWQRGNQSIFDRTVQAD